MSAGPLSHISQSHARKLLTRNDFKGEENDDGQPIKHIMYGCSSEGPSKLVFVGDLGKGHDCICHRSSNIGAHDDRNCHVNGYD